MIETQFTVKHGGEPDSCEKRRRSTIVKIDGNCWLILGPLRTLRVFCTGFRVKLSWVG